MQIWKLYYATFSDCLCKIQIKHIMMDAMARAMEKMEGKAEEHGAPEERPREKNPRAVFPQNQKTYIFY